MQPFYINVIVPLALRGVFTYRVPDDLVEEMIVGKRVVVPFGPKRLFTALVYQLNVQPAKGHTPKEVDYVLDNEPIVTESQFEFWTWMAHYYMCGMGSVMLAALPSAMRLSSQTSLVLTKDEMELDQLDEIDHSVLANLSDKLTRLDQLEKNLGKRKVQKSVDKLIRLGLVAVDESVAEQLKPKQKKYLSVLEPHLSDSGMTTLLDSLTNAPKQLSVIMKYLELSNFFQGNHQPVERSTLLNHANASSSIVKSLMTKGVLKEISENDIMSSLSISEGALALSSEQTTAAHEIEERWSEKNTILLHGVTGSGKTLLYADQINRTVKKGGQILFLVPEIALTTQLVARLKTMIDADVLVYHSRFSNRERLSMWMQCLDERAPQVIIGARSALFLPFKKLQLIVVDEEHESSYKQSESTPHYNAKDAALWLAPKVKAKVLLGSATPTVKTMYQARNGKFGLVNLSKRYGMEKLPEVLISDLRVAMKEKRMKADFTESAMAEITQTLKEKKQVIVFQNRRGYAPYQICESCGWSAECINCDVNLTYHRFFEKLLCHYCGHSLKQPKHCPQCGSAKLVVKGLGTEKIEDDLEILFPEAKIARMDADTTRKKQALQNLITAFEEGAYDMLVGTQMVTKGLDFENVGLVVVMNADSLWSRPNYQAFEQAFQLLTQVAGRAGRKHQRGKVLIQTYQPDHPVLQSIIAGSYDSMYRTQLEEREQFHYPPFSKMIKIQISHADAKFNKRASEFMAAQLRPFFGSNLLGPEEPAIARIRNKYLRHIFLKVGMNASAQKVRQAIWQGVDMMEGHKEFKRARIQIDVDP